MRLIYEDKRRNDVILRQKSNPPKSSRLLNGAVILYIYFLSVTKPASMRNPPAVLYKYHSRIGNPRVQRQYLLFLRVRIRVIYYVISLGLYSKRIECLEFL